MGQADLSRLWSRHSDISHSTLKTVGQPTPESTLTVSSAGGPSIAASARTLDCPKAAPGFAAH